MRVPWRRLTWVLIATVPIVAIAGVVWVATRDLSRYQARLTEQIRKVTGRELAAKVPLAVKLGVFRPVSVYPFYEAATRNRHCRESRDPSPSMRVHHWKPLSVSSCSTEQYRILPEILEGASVSIYSILDYSRCWPPSFNES